MNWNSGLGESGVRTVERWEEVGVSILYLCPSTTNVNRRTSLAFGWMSVDLDSKGPIDTDTSCLVKLSDLAASWGEEGLVILLMRPLRVRVTRPPPLLGND